MLEVTNLSVHFPVGGGRVVRAVDGVDFTLGRGETLGWWVSRGAESPRRHALFCG